MMKFKVSASLAFLMSLYSGLLVLLSGRLGFWDDAWWVFGFAYRYRWLNAMYSFAQNLHRPIEGVYWTSLYEVWGPDSQAFHFASLLLYALACGLMGLSLAYLLPHRPAFAILSTLFAFFLPAVAGTTYILQTDNGRLQMAFFWASVGCLLLWIKGGQKWHWFFAAFGFYTLSTLTYESGVLLVFTLPLWVWIAWQQAPAHRHSAKQTLFWLGIGVGVSFAAFLLARFTIFDGGAVGQRTLIPPPHYYTDYTLKAAHSFWVALREGLSDPPSVMLGLLVCAGTAAIFRFALPPEQAFRRQEERGLIVLGLGIFVLGGIPYFLAGYSYIQSAQFESATRLYSSSGYGLAMLLAWLLTRWDSPRPQTLSRLLALGLLLVFASYHAQQRLAWQGADRMRESIWQSWVAQIPEVQPQTVFVLVDFRLYYEFAPVIEVENGVNNYLQMLYDDPSITGNLVYLDDEKLQDEGRFITITSEGVQLSLHGFAPAENVIWVKRTGDKVEILESLTPDDRLNGAPLAAHWETNATRSSLARILPATPEDQTRQQNLIEG